jgi:hypothetical protein
MSLSDIERIQMGLRGRSLIEEKYSINAVAEKMSLLYKWLLKGGPIPNFVYNE